MVKWQTQWNTQNKSSTHLYFEAKWVRSIWMPYLHKFYNILVLLRLFVTSEDTEHQLPRCGHFIFGPRRYSENTYVTMNAQYSGLSERLIYVQDNITLTGYTTHSTVKSVEVWKFRWPVLKKWMIVSMIMKCIYVLCFLISLYTV